MEDYCNQNGNIPHFETSAKDDANVKELFLEVVKIALENYREEEPYFPPNANFQARVAAKSTGGKGGCC